MDKIFWLIPQKIAGRSGPDQDPWSLKSLKQGGIGAILTVNDGQSCKSREVESYGIRHAHIPFSNNAPPQEGDDQININALPQTYHFVVQQLENQRSVMIHCTAGKDRTGLTMCYYLMKTQGMNAEESLKEVRNVRPIALSAEGWEDMAMRVLKHFE